MNYILAYLPYAFITAYTPGPNNILALNAVSRKGLKRGKATLIGIAVGFVVVMALSAILCMELIEVIPQLAGVFKYIGAVYIVWLALHILMSKPLNVDKEEKGDFRNAFILQFINVKIILYAITIYSGYIFPYTSSKALLAVSVVCNSIIGISGCITWSLAGQLLQKQFQKHYRLMNIIMCVILLWSAVHLIL